MKNIIKTLLTLLILFCHFAVNAQTIPIPDPKFEQALIDEGHDTDGIVNGQILKTDAEAVKNLDVSFKEISYLTGIEGFVNLLTLHCHYNNLTTINTSQNTLLRELICGNNQITSLDVTNNTALTYLNFNGNQVTTIDLQNNTALKTLYCPNNKLTTLDVTVNTALTYLDCISNDLKSLTLGANASLSDLRLRYNQVSSLDLSQLPALTRLECYANNLSTLDVSANANLTLLSCSNNELSVLDITKNPNLLDLTCASNELSMLNVNNNPLLRVIYCYDNKLTELDLSLQSNLTHFQCYANDLISLDIRNGNNANVVIFNARQNNLECISVDPGFVPPANWYVDSGVDFSEDCNVVEIPDLNFEQALIDLGIDDGEPDGQLLNSQAESVSELYISSKGISDLTGIEYFSNLTTLNCGNNNLQVLDFSGNPQLTSLICNSNPLQNLNVTGNKQLDMLWCHDTGLQNLDISQNIALTRLDCYRNNLTVLNVTNNILLKQIECWNNQLSELDLKTNTLLTHLDCKNNLLENLDLSANVNLIIFQCDNNSLDELLVDHIPTLSTLTCSGNNLLTLDVSNNPILRWLECSNNNLEILNVSQNSNLDHLYCFSNQLTALNLQNGNNAGLTSVKAQNNNLACVSVDDETIVYNNWQFDAGVILSVDCSPPNVITKDITVELDRLGTADIDVRDIEDGTADNSTPANKLIFNLDKTLFSCDDIGDNTVVLSAENEKGVIGYGIAVVTVEDNIPPIVETVSSITVDLAGNSSITIYPVDVDKHSTDNCDFTLNLDYDTFYFIGTYEVNLAVTDIGGNAVVAPVSVEVVDSQLQGEELRVGKDKIVVYPNPFMDDIHVSFIDRSELDVSEVQLELVDEQYNQIPINVVQNGTTVTLQATGALGPGVYILIITIGNKSKSVSLIKP